MSIRIPFFLVHPVLKLTITIDPICHDGIFCQRTADGAQRFPHADLHHQHVQLPGDVSYHVSRVSQRVSRGNVIRRGPPA